MIKSVTQFANGRTSIELSDKDDINSLDTSYAVGSTARVTGKITEEYELTEEGWKLTSEYGSSSGGGLVLNLSESNVLDKTWKEIYDAIAAGASVIVKYPDDTDPQYGFEKKMSAVGVIWHDTGTETAEAYVLTDFAGSGYSTNEETGYPVKDE